MNKKGFTVIELIVSFTLVTVISIILFELIFSLKELYISGDIKTTLLNKQGIMIKKIYDDLSTDELSSITSCGVSCLDFTYPDGKKRLLVDVAGNTLAYSDYTMKLIDGSYFDNLSFNINKKETTVVGSDDAEFSINIPIKSKFLSDEDFGIHIVKTYNQGSLEINNYITVNDATIVANGIPLELREDILITGKSTIWAQIFHQDQIGIDKNSNDAYFTSYEEFTKTNSEHKKSSLKSLEVFRITDPNIEYLNKDNILEKINLIEKAKEIKLKELQDKNPSLSKLPEKESNKIDESYQDGLFELLLEYPSISTTNYNLWTQTSNFVKSSKLQNYDPIDIVYQGVSWNGLKYLTDKNANQYVNGSQGGNNFTIGVKQAGVDIKGPGGDYADIVDSVDLWIKADEYINKYALSVIYTPK